jgi:hypothetical protein
MGALAQLSQATVDVEPGRTATVTMTVRNTGTVVDRFSFEALGAAAPWVTFNPPSLSLFPEASGVVNITLSPPREPTVVAGPTPLGARVLSAEDSAGSVVEEATVNVGAYSDITVEMVPRVLRGRVAGRGQLAVDNRSNCSYRAALAGSDPKMLLAFSFRPTIIDVPPGAAAFVKFGVRPSSRFWRGPQKTHTFQVMLHNEPTGALRPPTDIVASAGATPAPRAGSSIPGPAGATPTPPAGTPPIPPGAATAPMPIRPTSPHKDEIVTDGSMLQEAMLPRWLLAALAALVALAILLVILWFALFKPQIKSTAQAEANKQLAANGITPVSGAGSKTGGGGAPSGAGGGGGGGSSTATTVAGGNSSNVIGSGGTGASASVNGSAQAAGNGTKVVFNVPTSRSLQITDLLVENSAGDTGNLTLARSGTPVMQWSMANFRDLDYHWITPTAFGPGTQMQLIVSGCTGACTPGLYYAGHLVTG